MHFLGLAGMPRRIPDYPDAYAGWNAIASYGSYVSVFGALFFLYVVYTTLTSDEEASIYPWAVNPSNSLEGPQDVIPTLEWLLPSPPAYHTYEEVPSIKV